MCRAPASALKLRSRSWRPAGSGGGAARQLCASNSLAQRVAPMVAGNRSSRLRQRASVRHALPSA
eukprot:2777133-Prymnesium_polylepis.1